MWKNNSPQNIGRNTDIFYSAQPRFNQPAQFASCTAAEILNRLSGRGRTSRIGLCIDYYINYGCTVIGKW